MIRLSYDLNHLKEAFKLFLVEELEKTADLFDCSYYLLNSQYSVLMYQMSEESSSLDDETALLRSFVN